MRCQHRPHQARPDAALAPQVLQNLLPGRGRAQAHGGPLDGASKSEGHGSVLLRPSEVQGMDGESAVRRTERRGPKEIAFRAPAGRGRSLITLTPRRSQKFKETIMSN